MLDVVDRFELVLWAMVALLAAWVVCGLGALALGELEEWISESWRVVRCESHDSHRTRLRRSTKAL